jgi:hypothetical protein
LRDLDIGTQVSPEILTQGKNKKNAPTKVRAILNTYG